jgi:hypothetical protein
MKNKKTTRSLFFIFIFKVVIPVSSTMLLYESNATRITKIHLCFTFMVFEKSVTI